MKKSKDTGGGAAGIFLQKSILHHMVGYAKRCPPYLHILRNDTHFWDVKIPEDLNRLLAFEPGTPTFHNGLFQPNCSIHSSA